MSAAEPTPQEEFAGFMARFPKAIVALAEQCLQKLRRIFPGTPELVYDYRDSVVVSFSPSARGQEGIVAVAIHAEFFRLYVAKDMPDPKGLLEGTGGKVRSVAVTAASELDRGDIHALLQAAIKHAGVTLPKSGPTQMIIQSSAKKKAVVKKRPAAAKKAAAKQAAVKTRPAAAKAAPKKKPKATKRA